MKDVIKLLDRVISMEDTEPLTMLGSYILGPITTDFQDLEESNFLVGLISDHANHLEVQDGTEEQLKQDWSEIKRLTEKLKQRQN